MEVKQIPIDQIRPNKRQPRQDFLESDLLELCQSIKTTGLLQPLLVCHQPPNYYELVAGERRLRAAKLAGFTNIPAILQPFTEQESAEAALVENLQRENLNPIEEACAYQSLIQDFNYTQQELADRLGKSRASIANAVRLTNLPEEIQQDVRQNKLSFGHAKILLGLKTANEQFELRQRILTQGLSVRNAEFFLQQKNKKPSSRKKSLPQDLWETQQNLQEHFLTRVNVCPNQNGSGKIEIHYYTAQDLQKLVEQILPS